jgi:hypothetical protein
MESEDPMLTKSRIDSADPNVSMLYVDVAPPLPPIRLKHRSEKDEPSERKSKALSDDPNDDMPYKLKELPHLIIDLIEMAEPRHV